MDSLNISEQRNKDSPIRAGRIRTTRYSTLTDDWLRAISHSLRCKGMSTPPNARRRVWRSVLGVTPMRSNSMLKRPVSRSASRRHSGAQRSRPTHLRSTAPKIPVAYARSNAGQVLFTGIAGSDRAACVAAGLMQPRFFSGWGIRTLARGEARYNPMSYHNGSVWPHDNALIALGFARYEHKRSIETLFEGLFSAATYMDLGRLPELFCGFKRQRGYGSTLYPVACLPQAWASATPFTLLEASLGLQFDPFNGEIRLHNPRLPAFLDEVILRNLQLGQSSVDVRVWRRNDTVSLDTPRTNGDIRVSIVLTH